MSTPTHAATCPWWLIRTFDNPLRRWVHNPQQILSPYVRPGCQVLDVGCGIGYFTLELARLVGPTGRVTAADLQPQMLSGVHRRAERAGLLDRIELHQATFDQIGASGPFDFALAFWMVHEVSQPEAFLGEIYAALRPGGQLLIVEPRLHVPGPAFERSAALAQSLGFSAQARPSVRISRAILLGK